MPPTRICAFVLCQTSLIGLSLMASSASAQELYREFNPTESGRLFGATMVLIEDLDNDGVRDLVVGEPGDGGFSHDPGRVLGVSAMSGAILWMASLGSDYDLFGSTLVDMGDVDGDGFTDVAAGAPGASSIATRAGSVALVSGRDGLILSRKNNRQSGERFGASLAKTHDLDGDGLGDLAVGAPGSQRGGLRGLVRILSSATLRPIIDLQGDSSSQDFGTSVVTGGDVDGDGIPEIWIGDPTDSRNKQYAGAVWIFAGVSQTVITRHDGKIDHGGMGMLANIGDNNQDGLEDILTAVYTQAKKGSKGRLVGFSGATGSRLFHIDGEDNDHMGLDVRSLGDVTGDGLPDFGAIGLATYIYDGQTRQRVAVFPASDSFFHESLVLLDDLDGDGRRDFGRGMPGSNGGGINSGKLELRLANDLYLYASSHYYYEGFDLRLHLRTGEANAPAAVFIEEVNGVPASFLLHLGTLDSMGSLDLGLGTVPPGLTGIDVQVRAFADSILGVEDSAQTRLRFL